MFCVGKTLGWWVLLSLMDKPTKANTNMRKLIAMGKKPETPTPAPKPPKK